MTRSIEEEYSIDSANREAIMESMMEPADQLEMTPILWYLALRAVDRFQTKYRRYPGNTKTAGLASDADDLWKEVP